MSWPLLALAIASFGIGTTEFIPMGLLPDLSRDLAVSIPSAGMLVSGYALGVTFGAPLLALATARLPRKSALLALMAVFIAGNVLCALAPDYDTLLLARILTSLCHGAFFGIGSVVATSLVPRRQRARAVSLMFSGLTLANILGVPLGTALGQASGWRLAFWSIVPIGVVAFAALAMLLPSGAQQAPVRLLREFAVLRRPQVALAMSMSVLASASLFSVFTYVAPMLETVSGIVPANMTTVLLLFGVAITIGNLAGGRLADWRPRSALIGLLGALSLAAVALVFASHIALPAVLSLLLWGGLSFSPGAALQSSVVDHAADAPNLAATLNQSAFNFGNALGAWAGGVMLSDGMPYESLPWLAAGFAAVAMVLAMLSAGLARRPSLVAAEAD